MRTRIALAPALLAMAAAALPTDRELARMIPRGQAIEARADGDLNGDGVADTVYTAGNDDGRAVTVLLGRRGDAKTAHKPVGVLRLDIATLGPTDLSIARGVLKVVDLAGGTTAVSTTYRYRFDKPSGRMRLIGLDATAYSRTYAHDGFEMSWNLLTGDAVTRELRLNTRGDDTGYDKGAERRSKHPSRPLYMETTPDPEEVMTALRRK